MNDEHLWAICARNSQYSDASAMRTTAVVIPCYESARFVEETVRSVLTQTRPPQRIVVVDPSSSDRPELALAELLATEPSLTVVRVENQGVAAHRNLGFAEVGPANHVLFLDADDVLESRMLETLVGHLEDHPEAGIAWCLPSFIDQASVPLQAPAWTPRYEPRGRFGIRTVEPERPETPFRALLALAGVVPSLAVMRCSVFATTGGFDEQFGHGFEDTDLILRMGLRAEVHHISEALVRHRRHPTQLTTDPGKLVRQQLRLYARWRDLSWLSPEHAETVRTAWRFVDRRIVPAQAVKAARLHTRAGRPDRAVRFLGGAARIAALSWLARGTSPAPLASGSGSAR